MYLSFAESRCVSQTSNQLGSQEGQPAFLEKLVKGSNLVNFLKKKRAVDIGLTSERLCLHLRGESGSSRSVVAASICSSDHCHLMAVENYINSFQNSLIAVLAAAVKCSIVSTPLGNLSKTF